MHQSSKRFPFEGARALYSPILESPKRPHVKHPFVTPGLSKTPLGRQTPTNLRPGQSSRRFADCSSNGHTSLISAAPCHQTSATNALPCSSGDSNKSDHRAKEGMKEGKESLDKK